MAADADLADDVGVAFEAERLIDSSGPGAGARQIDEHARRIGDALVVERHFAVELDRDPHGVRQHGMRRMSLMVASFAVDGGAGSAACGVGLRRGRGRRRNVAAGP